MRQIVAFGYRSGSGKDIAVKAILDAYGDKLSIRRYAFADEMRRVLGIMPGASLTERQRIACQNLAQYMREREPEYWIRKLWTIVVATDPEIALISDMRCLNEFGWVKGLGGKVIKLVRTDGYKLNGHAGKHATETQLDSIPDNLWDCVIEAGDVGSLKDGVLSWFNKEAVLWRLPSGCF